MRYSKPITTYLAAAVVVATLFITLSVEGGDKKTDGITPKQMADAVHTVLEAQRTVYAKEIVNRLQYEEKVIKATEHWKDDKGLPLPAQFFRLAADLVAEQTESFSYSLLSLWPVNKQNAPGTEVEKKGLQYVVDHPDKNYYGEEKLGGTKYFTAVYPDKAVSVACITCHNNHKDSPRTDFKLGGVMGGIVIRFPMGGG